MAWADALLRTAGKKKKGILKLNYTSKKKYCFAKLQMMVSEEKKLQN